LNAPRWLRPRVFNRIKRLEADDVAGEVNSHGARVLLVRYLEPAARTTRKFVHEKTLSLPCRT